jgi:MoaA/NifB/PqqE/SkfB family radical SAM enzyme
MRINADRQNSLDINNMLAVSGLDMVMLELTTRCNLHCVYCSHSRPHYQNLDMNDGDLQKIIDLLLRIRPTSVCINGHGETTIYRGWHILCNQLLDSSIQIDIISNFAKYYTDEEIDTLSRIHTIEVSIDTADPVLFKQLRRGGSLEKVIGTIYKIRSQAAAEGRPSPKFAISCVVSDKTIFGLTDLVKLGNQLDIYNFGFNDLYELPPLGEGCIDTMHISSLPDERILEASRILSNAISLCNKTNTKYCMHNKMIKTIAGGRSFQP